MRLFILLTFVSSCSLFGIQDEKGPKYTVLKDEGKFQIRRYEPYIVAKTTVKGDYDEASGKAFRILAGYIFGKNEGKKEISMTSPVEMKKTSVNISMTTPVAIQKQNQGYTMAFSMPKKYSMETLPKPKDERVVFEKVPSRLVAAHRYSWFSSQDRNKEKAQELRAWASKLMVYKLNEDFVFAGYNPPWTLPFFRRNEVLIDLKLKR